MKVLAFITLFFTIILQSYGQTPDTDQKVEADTIQLAIAENGDKPTIELNPGKAIDKEKKTKPRKKNVFYGVKTQRRFTKQVKGKTVIVEDFYVLKEYEKPNKYIGKKYYYDEKERKIVTSSVTTEKLGRPLHGTYVKMVNGDTIKRGIFYMGGKHGRWEAYKQGENMELVDKEYFYQGFPKDAEITYYDGEMTKVKEVIPIQHERKRGTYLSFYKSGRIAERGEYKEGVKVGQWKEYYDRWKKNNKKVTQYRKDPFDKGFEPYVRSEWNEDGKKIVGKTKRSRK